MTETVPSTAPRPPAAIEPTGGGCGRWWIGLAAGCGCLFLGALALVIAGTFWALVPGEQIPTEGIVGPESLGAARVERIADDEGVSSFLLAVMTDLLEEQQRVQEEVMPDELRWLSSLQASPASELDDLKKMLPRDATFIFEPAADGSARAIAAINMNRYPRLIRFVMNRVFGLIDNPSHHRIRHRGTTIDEFEEGFALAFVNSTMLLSGAAEDLPPVIDRLLDGTGGTETYPVAGMNSDIDWDVHAGFENAEGLFDEVFIEALGSWDRTVLFEEEGETPTGFDQDNGLPPGRIERFSIGLDIKNEDQVSARLFVDLSDDSDREAWAGAFEEMLDRWALNAQEGGMSLVATNRKSEQGIEIELELDDVRTYLRRGIRELMATDTDWEDRDRHQGRSGE